MIPTPVVDDPGLMREKLTPPPHTHLVRAVHDSYGTLVGTEVKSRTLSETVTIDSFFRPRNDMVYINPYFHEKSGNLVLMAVEDNLGKGAAGQAIQNANLMCGLPETMGLDIGAVYP